MNNLKRRKLNTLYLVLTTIAICTAIMTSIELSIIFVKFDERSEYAFPEGDEDVEN